MATIPTVTADGVRGHEFLLWTCLNTSPDGAKITMMDNTIINCFICFSLEETHVVFGFSALYDKAVSSVFYGC